MHLKAHRYFAKVAATGSFSATARHFKVPASSVSRFIAALEQELGQQLLYRHTRAVRLTDVGERYYAQIRAVLDLLDAADEEITGNLGRIRGLVRLNVPAALGRLHFARLAIELQGLYPELIIELSLNDEFIDPVEEGADIVLRVGQLEDSGLIGRLICRQQYLVCASPAYLAAQGEPATPEELAEHACLVHRTSVGTERWHFQRPGDEQRLAVEVSGPLRSNNSEVLLQAVLAGRGIGLFPSWLLDPQSFARGDLKPLLPDWEAALHAAPSPMHLISPENRLRSPKVRAVWDFLLEAIGSPPYWDFPR